MITFPSATEVARLSPKLISTLMNIETLLAARRVDHIEIMRYTPRGEIDPMFYRPRPCMLINTEHWHQPAFIAAAIARQSQSEISVSLDGAVLKLTDMTP